eukprot:COSAG04_NODE_28382_length_276_cov_0.581921_2_plen_43_part_01
MIKKAEPLHERPGKKFQWIAEPFPTPTRCTAVLPSANVPSGVV